MARDLDALQLPEVRALRRASQQEETDLSYVRRLLQGRIDILRAELSGRAGPPGAADAPAATDALDAADALGTVPPASAVPEPLPERLPAQGSPGVPEVAAVAGRPLPLPLVDRLPEILADGPSRHHSSARHVTLRTPHSAEYRRLAEDMLAEVELSDLRARTDEELRGAMGRLVRYERQVSRRRQRLQRAADECGAEIARRYREGEAQVDDLLS